MTNSPPSDAQPILASGQTIIALGSVPIGQANDQVDMRVYAGTIR